MIGQITPIIQATANAPSTYLKMLWDNFTNQFVYGTGTQYNEFPTSGLNVPSLSNPPVPSGGADIQTPGTSVALDPSTGLPVDSSQVGIDWMTNVQSQLTGALDSATSGDVGTNTWLLLGVLGGVAILVFWLEKKR